jgi:hypothetical protein
MRILLITALLLCTGCATKIDVRETDYFGKIEQLQQLDVSVEELPKPQVVAITHSGVDYAALTKTELDVLREYKAKSVKNAQALEAVLNASNAIVLERNLLLDAAKAQERRANMLERDYARAEEKLRQEERARLIEGFVYKIVIVGLAVGL